MVYKKIKNKKIIKIQRQTSEEQKKKKRRTEVRGPSSRGAEVLMAIFWTRTKNIKKRQTCGFPPFVDDKTGARILTVL